jgi:uncharacterized protein
MNSALYAGTVTHRRLRPARHRLAYRVFAMLLDLDELPDLDRTLRLFSIGRFNLFSFHPRDHGDGGADLRAHVQRQLARGGIADRGGPVRLLCYPRVLGYVFNPLSTYFCHGADGRLTAILYEVNNTFGDRHSYVIPVAPDSEVPIVQSCAKALHVSPFLGLDMVYRFSVLPPGDELALAVAAQDATGPVLTASFSGRHMPLTDAMLARLFLRYPLMTVKVIAGIHWEALRLWRKGVPFHRRPVPPSEPVTAATRREALDA